MQFIIFGLIQGTIQLISKLMDGKKTKAGIGLVVAGSTVSAVSMWGVDVAPDQLLNVIEQVLSLFGYSLTGDAHATAQSLLGNLLALVGAGVTFYGYVRKGQLITK